MRCRLQQMQNRRCKKLDFVSAIEAMSKQFTAVGIMMLKERGKIRYHLLDMANKYPVHFQFIPTELAHKINSIEEITFA